jgi:membrane-bound lytic murein transglycosylase D
LHKILPVGLILFLATTCLPHVTVLHADDLSDHLLAPEEDLFALFQPDPEQCGAQGSGPSPLEAATSLSPLVADEPSKSKMDLPLQDELAGGSPLEAFPAEQGKKEPDFDIPIVINAKVEQFIQYFQTAGKSIFSSWLARSEKYIPIMKNLMKESGLPEDLVYMALIESGFNPYAYSRRKATGPWQFIYPTGKKYGLQVNWWIDERRDPEKSTIAAAKYLKDLYDMFENWYLAAAGYNAGEGKIVNAIKRYRTEDFWELTKYRYLRKETKDYVPQLIAAALIAKDPEKYGFENIEYHEPLRYEKVTVPEATHLRLIAKASEISVEELKDLNPELRRWCTPPNTPDYEIKIPFGKKELFLKNFEALRPARKFQFKTHVVKKGDTLSGIAKRYRVDLDPILEINRLKKTTRLSIGMNLLIPVPQDEKRMTATHKLSNGDNQEGEPNEFVYTIKKGDTLWSIANEMAVNIGALSRWNNLHPEKKLIPGDKLKIKVSKAFLPDENSARMGGKEIIYIVKEGDTLWDIAQKYDLTLADIRDWNQLNGGDRIYPADRLKLRVKESKSSTLN